MWTGLLCLANDSPSRGRLLVAPGVGLRLDEMAEAVGIDQPTLERVVAGLIELKMVAWQREVLTIANWDKRQFASDCSSERVRRHRRSQAEAERDGETGAERSRNAPETDTERETDTDPDTEEEEGRATTATAALPPPPPDTESFAIPAPPAVEAYREMCGCYPQRATHALIDERVGERQADIALFRRAIGLWSAAKYDQNNVLGILDWYGDLQAGVDPTAKRRQGGKPPGRKRQDTGYRHEVAEIEPFVV